MSKRIIKNSSNFKLQTSNLLLETGFTMIEILIATAITAILSTGLIMATLTVFSTNSSVTNHQMAIKQVQNAADYISRDVQQAQPSTPSYSWVNSTLRFKIPTSSDGATFYYADYTVNNGTLIRTKKDMSENIVQTQNIATDIGGFTVDASVPYVSVTSTVTGLRSATESRVILLVQ